MKKNTALAVLAAGVGARFGGGIKQLAEVGTRGQTLMEYSVHDAIAAGFNKIIFIIRPDMRGVFAEMAGERIERACARLGITVDYAYQRLEDVPAGFCVPQGRTKPWGTGQAILSLEGTADCPFAVINADDYYGKQAYFKLHSFLTETRVAQKRLCMISFVLKNTLSDSGGVTRGVCRVSPHGRLLGITETYKIEKVSENGLVRAFSNGAEIPADSPVSMNMWGLTPEFIGLLRAGFADFLRRAEPDAEYVLPVCIDGLIKRGEVTVDVLGTNDPCIGVTYRQDREAAREYFARLHADGVYKDELFSDL